MRPRLSLILVAKEGRVLDAIAQFVEGLSSAGDCSVWPLRILNNESVSVQLRPYPHFQTSPLYSAMAFRASAEFSYSTKALPVDFPNLSHLIPHLFSGPISANKTFHSTYTITLRSLFPVSGPSPSTTSRVLAPGRVTGLVLLW